MFVRGDQIMYERFVQLLHDNNTTAYQVSKATGIAQTTLSAWKNGKSIPKIDKLQKIADYFNVSLDYLVGKTNCYTVEDEIKEAMKSNKVAEINPLPELTDKDQKDISKKLAETLEQLEAEQDGLMFDGEPLDDMTRELLLDSLKHSMEMGKKLAKQKYTPKKYRN